MPDFVPVQEVEVAERDFGAASASGFTSLILKICIGKESFSKKVVKRKTIKLILIKRMFYRDEVLKNNSVLKNLSIDKESNYQKSVR